MDYIVSSAGVNVIQTIEQSMTASALAKLENELCSTEVLLSSLRTRLYPVLRPNLKDKDEGKVGQTGVPLVDEINIKTEKLIKINKDMQEIISLLEI